MSNSSKDNYYGIILAGGGGTRLWPKSTNNLPKQFLKIGSNATLLQDTFSRLAQIIPSTNIYIVASSEYNTEIKKELPNVQVDNILTEPSPKNTAPAIALAVWEINKKNKDAVVGSFASDHLVKNNDEFCNDLQTAYTTAENSSYLVTIGIVPNKADAGLGYIHVGKQLEEANNTPIFKVKQFLEKPDMAKVKAFIASGEYFWNASYFVGKASTFLGLYEKHLPQILSTLKELDDKVSSERIKLWQNIENVAVDYGIMEKADNLAMVPGDFDWSDVGNWAVLADVFPKDSDGNVVLGEDKTKNEFLDSKNCLVFGDGKMIAAVGVSDLVIVEAKDSILICHKDKAQQVKDLVEKLKSESKDKYL